MGNRLSKLVTKTGDTGKTHFGCDMISKGHPAIEVIGDIDELNSHLGLSYALITQDEDRAMLEAIQQCLFDAGGELYMADATKVLVKDEALVQLEDRLVKLNEALPPLKEFVMPRGTELGSRLHVARAVCRRAERHLWKYLGDRKDLHLTMAKYLNRLSDLLFVMARAANQVAASKETLWASRRSQGA